MANKTIDQQDSIYNNALKNFDDTMSNFEQTFTEVSQALIENKTPPKTANEIISYLLTVKRSLLAVKFELHTIKEQLTKEDK